MGKRAIWMPAWLAFAAMMLALPVGAQILAQRGRTGSLIYTNDGGQASANIPSVRKHSSLPLQPPSFGRFAPLVRRVAETYRLDPRLVNAIVRVESRGNPHAVSPKGAMGLMQLVPATASRFGVANVFNPGDNLRGGAAYLHELVNHYHGDLNRVLAAYYAGEGAVERAANAAPTADTADHIGAVLGAYYHTHAFAQPPAPSPNPIYVTADAEGRPVFTNQ